MLNDPFYSPPFLLSHSESGDVHSHVAASLTLVYDHHKTKITDKLLDLQHAYADCVVSTMHVHLDHDLCMEQPFVGMLVNYATWPMPLAALKGCIIPS